MMKVIIIHLMKIVIYNKKMMKIIRKSFKTKIIKINKITMIKIIKKILYNKKNIEIYL
jgi:hypothetical protein